MEESKYDVFLSYYSGSGRDYAFHLKSKLTEMGVSVFFAEEDIPKTVKSDSEEWRKIIDQAIVYCKKFILIMTLGFNDRPEVIREIKLAIKLEKEIIYCKYSTLLKSMLKININGKELDVANYIYNEFENREDLLRKVGSILFGAEDKKANFFNKRTKQLLQSEGEEWKNTDEPLIEIIVGSTNQVDDWFTTSLENKSLVSSNPITRGDVTIRRKFFDCESSKSSFCRVHSDGYFHMIEPMIYDYGRSIYYIDTTVSQIIEFLIYCIRVLKNRNFNENQSVYIILRNINGLEFQFDTRPSVWKYSFSDETKENDFTNHFTPSANWAEHKNLFKFIYREICKELGVEKLEERVENMRVYNIIDRSQINTTYTNTDFPDRTLHSINIKEFGFSEEDLKI